MDDDKQPKDQLGHEHYTLKYVGPHNEKRVLSLSTALMAVLFLAVVFGFRSYLTERATIARRACEANPTRSGCDPVEPIMPIDPRCANHPDHRKCQAIDPTDPTDPGGDPIPPTPPSEDDFTFSGTVVDNDGFTVPAGEVWTFDPTKNTTVEVEANVVVYGVLEMRPNDGVKHTLRFNNVDESKFVGGGMELIDDDTGLWVLGDGKLDAYGEKKVGWDRTGNDATWKSTDELIVTPVNPGDYTFKSFTKGSSVPQLDASVPKAEVMNMTRSVNIEGTPDGYSHVMFMSTQPQTIKYTALRYMGIDTILGRYPLHFHFMGEASRGSLIEGTVVRDSKDHAYVAHASHGVTFRDTVAYNITDDAYWWDPVKGTGSDINATNDIVYDHAIVANVFPDPDHPYNLSGFSLSAGEGGVVKNSVGVGILGSENGSAFAWPANDVQVWAFSEGNVAHNNKKNGITVWQNTGPRHDVSNFVAYSNGVGIDHGAYSNNYFYTNIYLYKNGTGAQLHASARDEHFSEWKCVKERGSTNKIALQILNTNAGEVIPVKFIGSDFENQTVNDSPQKTVDRVTFVNGTCS